MVSGDEDVITGGLIAVLSEEELDRAWFHLNYTVQGSGFRISREEFENLPVDRIQFYLELLEEYREAERDANKV
jgi:hypothetical protein